MNVGAKVLFVIQYFIPLFLVRQEFRHKSQSVARSDFKTIEHMIRQGYKQKKLMEMPGFNSASFSQ